MKPKTMRPHSLTLVLLVAILGALTSGCYTTKREVALKPGTVPCTERRQGTLGIKVVDKREDRSKIGHLGGRLGANPDLVSHQDLASTLGEMFKATLERAGYTVVPEAQPTLECEIREFWVHADGWTQGATEKVHAQLRDKKGDILWDHSFKGEDGGMDMTAGFAKKSMNTALTRLLSEAMEAFTSEFFYQSLKKAGTGSQN
jgi:hypothetical protein